MIRKGIYSIDYIESILREKVIENLNYKKYRKDKSMQFTIIDGEEIYTYSDRHKLFFTKGYKCVDCGLQASYFALEKDSEEVSRYHLNLYGLNENEKEILFTKDHIIPVSGGGKNNLDNYQTMCCICNSTKGGIPNGNKVPKENKNQPKQERFLIKINNQYINIKPTQLIVNYVDSPGCAKTYTKQSGLELLKRLAEKNILSNEDICNCCFVKRAKEMYG